MAGYQLIHIQSCSYTFYNVTSITHIPRVFQVSFTIVRHVGVILLTISFAAHINGNSIKWEYVQIDLMLAPNLEWAKFLYHSPDFTKNESQYKGYYRNILLMAIITETQKKIMKTTPEGGIEEIKVNILRYPKGIWRVTKSFKGKRGLVKNGKNIGTEYLITDQPGEAVHMTVGLDYRKEDIDTFEKLLCIVKNPYFIWKEKRPQIIERFEECLKEQSLPLPREMQPMIWG